jgi:RNA polymerase-interacting CarD/CdnL/TRCF family regulator
MKKRNVENSVSMLKNLRDTYHCQLDISVVTELNHVIAELEKVGSHQDSEYMRTMILRALQILGVVISVVSNIKDLMK